MKNDERGWGGGNWGAICDRYERAAKGNERVGKERRPVDSDAVWSLVTPAAGD